MGDRKLADHLAERAQAADLLLATFAADSLDHSDSIRAVWHTVQSPEARYAEVLSHLQEGDYTAANALVQGLSSEFTEKQAPAEERDRMAAYITYLAGVQAEGNSPYTLATEEVDALEALAGTGNDRAAVWAHNLLCSVYGRCTPPLTGGDEGGEKSLHRTSGTTEPADGDVVLGVYPNPSTTWVAVDYDLRAAADHAALVVRDITGREVARLTVPAERGQLVWDVREVPAGTYTAELLNGGLRLRAEKLVVRP